MNDSIFQNRVSNLRRILAAHELESLLVSKPENRRYLSGFSGSSGILLVTCDHMFLFTDGRYEEQARMEASEWSLVIYKRSFVEELVSVCADLRIKELGFEKDFMTYQQFELLKNNLPDIEVRPVSGLVEGLRRIKDETEIQLIQEACTITCSAFQYLLGELRAGQKEREIAGLLEYFMRCQGGSLPAFETIVAAGRRSALPHGVASDQVIRRGHLVVLDMGATFKGYASDLTRTICIGRFDSRQREIYEIVLEAQARALSFIRAGVTAGEADAAARDFIRNAGYADFFPHSLGHGVGLSVHEEPLLAVGQNVILEEGMVVTVEPGIYLPGWGGVRIEDTVLVTQKGCKILTPVSKELIIV